MQPKRKFKEHGHSSSSGMQNNNNMAEKSDWVEEGTKPSVAPSRVDHNLEIYHPVNILDQIFQKMTGRHL